MRRLPLLVGLGLTLALVSAAGAGDSIRIRATSLAEERPVAGNGYLAWTQNSRKQPRIFRPWAQAPGGKPFLITGQRQGYPGSIEGTMLVYQAYAPARNESSIRFYDLARKAHVLTPRGVNTSLWEWSPSLSGEWLLFSRHNGRTESVILLNTRTRVQRELDRGRMPDEKNYATAGQVNGNFAVWQRCPRGDRPCTVVRYDITTRAKTQLPPPLGFVHYQPAVTADGTTYLVRGEPDCASEVEVWRYPLAGEPTFVFPVPIGQDIWNTYLETVTGPTGTVHNLYHDRVTCGVRRSDLWLHSEPVVPVP